MSLTPLVPLLDGAVDLVTGVVRRGGQTQALSPQEQALLARLVTQPNTTVDRHELVAAIGQSAGDVRAVDFAMRRLRAKLEVDPGHPRHLVTVYGTGYRFEPLDRAEPEPLAVPPETEAAVLPGHRRVDLARREVIVPGRAPVPLTSREASVLAVLLAVGGRAVSREDLLHRVWDTRRRSALRYVDQIVHRLRGKLDDDGAVLRTVSGVGYLLERAPGGSPAGEGHVEAASDTTFGHEGLEEHVESLLAAGRAVSLVGAPGAGKSRLAASVAARLSLPSWRVELSRTHAPTAAEVAARVAETLGLPIADRAGVDEIGWALRAAGPLLLLLDGADPAAEILPELLAGWQTRAPEVRLLVTSQTVIEVSGPRVEVPPLDPEAARALFVDRAAAARCAWDASAHEAAIDTLCERLDRLPLAIELAAARAGVLTPEQTLAQLDRRFALLRQPGRGSLRETLDWSWALLSEAARAALQRLSAFESGFDLDAARDLVDGDVLGEIDALHRASWLRVEVLDGRVWYRIGESMRAFALDALTDAGGEREVFERHAAWVIARTRPHLLAQGLRHRTAVALRADRDELRVAWERASDPATRAWAWVGYACVLLYLGPPGPIPELVWEGALPSEVAVLVGLVRLLRASDGGEQRRALEALEEMLPLLAAAPRQRGIVLAEIAHSLMQLGDPGAGARFSEAVAALVEAGADDLAAIALALLAWVRRQQGDPAEATALLSEGLSRAQASGDIFAEAHVRNSLGLHGTITGNLDEGEAELRRALGLFRTIAYLPGRRAILNNLGNLQMHRGDLDGAAASYGEALEDARQSGRRPVQARLLTQVAFVHLGRGELEAAEREVRRSLELHRETQGRDQGYALGCLGMIAQSHGRHAEAVALYQRAQASFVEAGDRIGAAQFQALEVSGLAEGGAVTEAWNTLRAAPEAARQALGAPTAAIWRCAEAVVRAVAGDQAGARALLDAPDPAHDVTFTSRWLANRATRT